MLKPCFTPERAVLPGKTAIDLIGQIQYNLPEVIHTQSAKYEQFHNSPSIRVPGHAPSCDILIGDGAIHALPEVLQERKLKKVFVFADCNTYPAAGAAVCAILEQSGALVVKHIFDRQHLLPDENSVGLAIMHFDPGCDGVIGVGSGVINDICKIVAAVSAKPYIIVATAPSMDGYASATSSMERNGLKVSVNSKCPDVIIGDTAVLAQAPMKMLASGLGDMVAKYISICEWRISHLINGEPYSEDIAAMVRMALKKCVDNLDGLLLRDKAAVASVFEGLAICGIAMSYAGLSRPASGCEHYLSHVLDMRNAQFKTPVETHGLQCAMGTLITARLYEKLRTYNPDREKALQYVEAFDYEGWCAELRKLLGAGAETMIRQETREGKYVKSRHAARLETILANWEQIQNIIHEEVPSTAMLEELLDKIQAPKSISDIGTDESYMPVILGATRDIRDKYVLSRLLWDLGIAPETALYEDL